MSENGDPALIGRRVAGKFVIEKFLGGGAMGAVYRAKDSTLDRSVALKVMHPTLAVDPSFGKRFHREARAASRIDHASAMRVIEFGEEASDGLLYIAMEYLEGRDLYKVIHEDWPLAEARIADIMQKALGAMQVAHDMGVIHRDLKPENIMILHRKDDEGQDIVKVCDFGIAKITEADDEPSRQGTGAKLTTTGLVVGTPEYMSPEQARGEKLDARSDLYSMGVILYQLLTGRVPFLADTALGVVLKHITEIPDPPSVHYPGVHKGLEAVCVRTLSKLKEERFQSAREMRAAIRAAIEGRPMPVEVNAATDVAQTPISEPKLAGATTSAGAPAISQPMKVSGTSKITPLGTAIATDSAATSPSRVPLFAGVALVAVAVGASAFVFVVRPALSHGSTPTTALSAPGPSSAAVPFAKSTEHTASSAVVSAPAITPEPPASSPQGNLTAPPPRTSRTTSGGAATPVPAAAPEPAPAAAPAPAPAPAPEPAPAPVPAPAPAPAPPPAPAIATFNAATCHATTGQKKATSGVNAKDLTLNNADGTWSACARTLKEKPAGPIAATIHLRFSDTKSFRGATCNGCPPAIAQCVTGSASKVASVSFHGGDVTGDPEFDVPVTFSCD